MDEQTLNYLRTSLKKNPEEWVFEEEIKSSSRVPSTLNVFSHSPTDYILILVFVPAFSMSDIEFEEDAYFIDIMSFEEYQYEIESRGGAFKPNEKHLEEVHPESIIVKTLLFIKAIAEEDEKIVRYSGFKDYVDKKYGTQERSINYYGDN